MVRGGIARSRMCSSSNGLVWTHMNVPAKFNVAANGWIKVPDTSAVEYRIQGLDLRSGEVRRELSTKDLFNVGHHHRCYRNKITERFLMASRRGVEFVDLASGENYQNHWVRSGCLLGNLPCNGLLYVAPHSCGCYLEAKLTGFNALAAEKSVESPESRVDKLERRRAAKNGCNQALRTILLALRPPAPGSRPANLDPPPTGRCFGTTRSAAARRKRPSARS